MQKIGMKRVLVVVRSNKCDLPLKRLATERSRECPKVFNAQPQAPVPVVPPLPNEAPGATTAKATEMKCHAAVLGTLSVTAPTISDYDKQRLSTLVCAASSIEPDDSQDEDEVTVTTIKEEEPPLDGRVDELEQEQELPFDSEMFEIQQKKETITSAAIHPDFIANQAAIDEGMRRVLLDWLSEVVSEYKMTSDCLFLAKNYIDRYLSRKQVSKSDLQLLGATALLITAKLEETQPLGIDDFVFLCANLYNREAFIAMERKALGVLSFELLVPHEKFFLRCFQRISANDDLMVRHTIDLTTWLSSYILELSVLLVEMTKFKPSIVAAACMCIARAAYGIPAWSKALEKISKISWTDQELKTCCSHLLRLYSDSNATQNCAVRKKYNSEAFAYVSRFPIPVRIPALTPAIQQ